MGNAGVIKLPDFRSFAAGASSESTGAAVYEQALSAIPAPVANGEIAGKVVALAQDGLEAVSDFVSSVVDSSVGNVQRIADAITEAVEPAAAIAGLESPAYAAHEERMPSQPKGIPSPHGGVADDLKMISGVGPKIEKTLHDLGIFHFSQIANWTLDEVKWVDDYLKFSGRISRDAWIAQADALAAGGADEYMRRFGRAPR